MFQEMEFNEEDGVFAFVALVGSDEVLVNDLKDSAEKFAGNIGGVRVESVFVSGLKFMFLVRNGKANRDRWSDYKVNSRADGTIVKVGTVFDPPEARIEETESWAGRNGRYVWMKWDKKDLIFEATTDFLGIRAIFYAEVNGRLIITTEPSVLFHSKCLPKELDPVGCVDMLQKGCCYGNRTLLKAVRYLPPVSVLKFEKSCVTTSRYKGLPIEMPEMAQGSLEHFADGLYERLRTSTRRRTLGIERWQVFLSGGLDSRACLGLLRDAGCLCGAINWGQQRIGDSLIAKKIADECNVPFTYIPIGHDHLYKHHKELISIAGGLTNAHITYLIAVLRALGYDNTVGLSIGYLGDVLTGSKFSFKVPGGDCRRPTIEDSVDHFHGAFGRFFKPSELETLLVLPEWKDGIDACRQDIKKTMLAAGTDEYYQRWIAAILWCRQLRYTVFLPRLVDSFSPVFSPFEDIEVFRFALSFPPDALQGQAAYRKMFERHFSYFNKYSNQTSGAIDYDGKYSVITKHYRQAVAQLPKIIKRRLDYWSSPGYSIDPNGDLRKGSAGYLHGLLEQHNMWDWAINFSQVSRLVEDHIADKKKSGFQIQALATLIEAMISTQGN